MTGMQQYEMIARQSWDKRAQLEAEAATARLLEGVSWRLRAAAGLRALAERLEPAETAPHHTFPITH